MNPTTTSPLRLPRKTALWGLAGAASALFVIAVAPPVVAGPAHPGQAADDNDLVDLVDLVLVMIEFIDAIDPTAFDDDPTDVESGVLGYRCTGEHPGAGRYRRPGRVTRNRRGPDH